jgi:chromosome partitioning protein
MTRMRDQMVKVAKDYDVILIDSPPSLGAITAAIGCAADAVLIPLPPKVFDLASTVKYVDLLDRMQELRRELGIPPIKTVRVVPTMVDLRLPLHVEFHQYYYQAVFPRHVSRTIIRSLADVENAMALFRSVFEVDVRDKRAREMYLDLADELREWCLDLLPELDEGGA